MQRLDFQEGVSVAVFLNRKLANGDLGNGRRKNEAEGEKAMGRLILKSILATGKGTKKKPYAVMRVEDEKDVLSALKKQAGAQFLVRDKSRVFDLLQCSDESEVYFDITLFYGRGKKV
jgi:hypothetical protein